MAKWDAHAYKTKCALLSKIFDPIYSANEVSNKLSETLSETDEIYFDNNLKRVQIGVEDDDGFVYLL